MGKVGTKWKYCEVLLNDNEVIIYGHSPWRSLHKIFNITLLDQKTVHALNLRLDMIVIYINRLDELESVMHR